MNESRDERLQKIYGAEGLERLRRQTVAVIGVGLLGGRIALELAGLGVPLVLVDPGDVEPANLCNQHFPADSVGRPKVEVRAAQIRALVPEAAVVAIQACVEDLGIGAFERVALICGGLDGRSARVHLGKISHQMQRRWIDAAVDGSGKTLRGTVTFWDPTVPDAPCQCCRYPASELAAIRTEGRGPGCPSWLDASVPVTPPTLMASPFGGIVSGFALLFAIDALRGHDAGRANTRLHLSAGDTLRTDTVSVTRSAACRMVHEPLVSPVRVPSRSLSELWRQGTRVLGGQPDNLRLLDRSYVSELRCTTCGASQTDPVIVGAFADELAVCGCPPGARRAAPRLESRFTHDDVLRFGRATWTDMGLPPEDVVTARRGDRQVHFIVGEPTWAPA